MNVLVVDDDRVIAEGLGEVLESEGHAVVIGHDTQIAELILEHQDIALALCDIRLTGPFRFEGLEFIDHVRERAPHCKVIIMSGDVTPEIETEALRRGARAVLQKPFPMERLEAFLGRRESATSGSKVILPTIDDVLAGEPRINPVFQPIVDLTAGVPRAFAFEALCRIQTHSLLARPDLLFEYASRLKRVVDLELATIRRSIENAAALAGDALLFFNVHPASLTEGDRFAGTLIGCADENALKLDRVVLELTEQQAIRDDDALISTLASLRTRGVRFAFDDVGSAYSHLSIIDQVRPEFLKVSQQFGSDFEVDPTKGKVVRNLLALASDFGSELILEGIETAATARAARDLGITLGQGYYFARPALAENLGNWTGAGAEHATSTDRPRSS